MRTLALLEVKCIWLDMKDINISLSWYRNYEPSPALSNKFVYTCSFDKYFSLHKLLVLVKYSLKIQRKHLTLTICKMISSEDPSFDPLSYTTALQNALVSYFLWNCKLWTWKSSLIVWGIFCSIGLYIIVLYDCKFSFILCVNNTLNI